MIINNTTRNFSSYLKPEIVQRILLRLGIEWNTELVDSDGWVKTDSPLRMKSNHPPTFWINVNHGGFYDSSTGEKGDIVNLFSKMKGWPISMTIQVLAKNYNINYKTKAVRYF